MRTWGLLLAGVTLCCSAVGAQEISQAEYGTAISRAAEQVEAAADLGDGGEKQARSALDRLPLAGRVVSADGSAHVLDNERLIEGLREQVGRGPDGIRSAARTLSSLGESLSVEQDPAPAEARAVLAGVLSRREFRLTWWDKLQARIAEWLFRLLEGILKKIPFPNLRFLGGLWRPVGWALLAVAAIIVVFLVVRLVSGIASARIEQGPEELAEPVHVRTYEEWLDEAQASVEKGDFRAALRAQHMAALLRLDDAGILPYEEANTDRTFVRLLRQRGRSEIAAALAAINDLFARAWFGSARAGASEYQSARDRWDQLEALIAP